jgi:hypothetical protein
MTAKGKKEGRLKLKRENKFKREIIRRRGLLFGPIVMLNPWYSVQSAQWNKRAAAEIYSF